MSTEKNQVSIRLPLDDNETFVTYDAFLINENLTYAIFDEQLEIHIVAPTSEQGTYDLKFASNPIFYVGDAVSEIFEDLQKMNLIEFARKYTHSDFHR